MIPGTRICSTVAKCASGLLLKLGLHRLSELAQLTKLHKAEPRLLRDRSEKTSPASGA